MHTAPDGEDSAFASQPEAPPALARNSARGGACRDLKCELGARRPSWRKHRADNERRAASFAARIMQWIEMLSIVIKIDDQNNKENGDSRMTLGQTMKKGKGKVNGRRRRFTHTHPLHSPHTTHTPARDCDCNQGGVGGRPHILIKEGGWRQPGRSAHACLKLPFRHRARPHYGAECRHKAKRIQTKSIPPSCSCPARAECRHKARQHPHGHRTIDNRLVGGHRFAA